MESNRIDKLNGVNSLSYIVRSSLVQYHSVRKSEHFSIKYAKSGSEFYILDGKRYELSSGQFLVVNPEQSVEIEIESRQNVEGRCFFLSPQLIAEIRSRILNPELIDLGKIDFTDYLAEISNQPIQGAGTLLNNFFDDQLIETLSSELEVTDYIISLGENLFTQQRSHFNQLATLQGKSLNTKKELFKRIETGRSFMHSNLSEEIHLDEIASAANLSPYHFHRCFRAFYRQTPHQYLQNLRMQYAHDQILNKNQSMTDLAFQSGFSDPKYFRKSYKKWLKSNAGN